MICVEQILDHPVNGLHENLVTTDKIPCVMKCSGTNYFCIQWQRKFKRIHWMQ